MYSVAWNSSHPLSHCYAMQSNPFGKILNLAIFVVVSPPSGLENFNATGRSAFSRTCTRHLRHHAMQQPIWVITGQLEIQLGEQTDQLH